MNDHNRRMDDKPIVKIIKLWPIILSLVAIVVSFTILKVTVEANTNRIQQNIATLNRNTDDHDMFRQRLIRLETIAEMVPEMRSDINDIKRILMRNGGSIK